jgi:hypothetical protein
MIEPETESEKADYISKAVGKILHTMTDNGIVPDWETIEVVVKEGFNIISGPDWYDDEKEGYLGPYVGWEMKVGVKFYSENYQNKGNK